MSGDEMTGDEMSEDEMSGDEMSPTLFFLNKQLFQAKSALATNYNNLNSAIEWLLAGNTAPTTSSAEPSNRRRRRRGTFCISRH